MSNNGFIALTKSDDKNEKTGTKFIRDACSSKESDSFLKGKNNYVLPNTSPEITKEKIWSCNVIHNGKKITNNYDFGTALITWYNKYAEAYGLDANVLVAQMFHESAFKCWNYSTTGALGITQFIPIAIQDIIINNNGSSLLKFTQEEKDKITKDLDKNLLDYLGKYVNRAQLHQNVIDNPEIMIKAQASHMKKLANKGNNFTSIALFGYNRGGGVIKDTYLDSIEKANSYGKQKSKPENNYEMEGILYVEKIFKTLYKDLGYTDLNMDEVDDLFDETGINMLNNNMKN